MPGSGGTTSKEGNSFQQYNQQKDPWGPSQPHLKAIMESAAGLYGDGTQQSVADLDWRTRQGISDATLIAGDRNHPLEQLQSGIRGLQSTRASLSGPTYAERNLPGMISQAGAPTWAEQYIPGLMGKISGPSAAETYLTGVASGETAGKNPHLDALLDANANRIGNRVNSAVSGAGRYGSFAHGDALARTINETNLPILSQSYENDRARQLQATGQIDSARQAATGLGLQGAGMLDSSRANARNFQLQGTGLLDASRRSADQQALSIDQLMSSLAPMYQSLQYAPSQMMMDIGGKLQNQTQQQMNSPWTNLGKYSGAVSGLSGLLQGMGSTQGSQWGKTSEDSSSTMGWGDMLKFGSNTGALGLELLGFLSDRNEKTDIKKVGTNERTGLDIFSYRYKGDPKTYPKIVGPMAQDIEKKFPGSTGLIDGKMYVKPEAAGLLGAL